MTSIAVLGAGKIGSTLARKWVAAGHRVILASRQPSGPDFVTLAQSMGATGASHAEAVSQADVILLALPGSAVPDVAQALGTALDGKVVIDASNNIGATEMSGIPTVVQHAPAAILARAFNSLGWETFANPVFDGVAADLFWCGPDGASGDLVAGLIRDVGLRPMRLGDLDQVPLVDTMGKLWLALALGQGRGRHLAFKVLGSA